jgi:hypothetical protein
MSNVDVSHFSTDLDAIKAEYLGAMSDPNATDPSRGGKATVLWVCALVPAAAATVVLVLSNDVRLLRLGLVAALWATLIGAFAVARLRHRVVAHDGRVAELQRVYELELEQEVAARREFELEAENEAYHRVAKESQSEIQALRGELRNLRESLERTVGGDPLLGSRRAESPRVWSLADPTASNQAVHPHPGWATPPGSMPSVEPNTRLIGRLDPQATDPGRPSVPAPQNHQPGPAHVGAEAPPRPVWRDALPQEPWPQQDGVGAHSRPQPSVREQQHSSDWSSQLHPGAHTQGTSVTELLAAYGGPEDSGRRRRRRE